MESLTRLLITLYNASIHSATIYPIVTPQATLTNKAQSNRVVASRRRRQLKAPRVVSHGHFVVINAGCWLLCLGCMQVRRIDKVDRGGDLNETTSKTSKAPRTPSRHRRRQEAADQGQARIQKSALYQKEMALTN